MSPRVPKSESMAMRDLELVDILTSSGKYPERPKKWPPDKPMLTNALRLLEKLNRLQMYWERPIVLSSGYRPAEVNATVPGAAKNSLHRICAAGDVLDPGGALGRFCLGDLPMLDHLGLWMEDPAHTKGWCHLQIFPPRSGNRVFLP